MAKTQKDSTSEIDYEEIQRKNNYRNLINNIGSIIYSLDCASKNVKKLKENINAGIRFDDKCYENDNIDSISESISACCNSLSSISSSLSRNL